MAPIEDFATMFTTYGAVSPMITPKTKSNQTRLRSERYSKGTTMADKTVTSIDVLVPTTTPIAITTI